MNIDLSPEALEFGRQVSLAIHAAGGDLLVQDAEREPQRRAPVIESLLAELGAWDLSPRTDSDELEASAALCRSAGHSILPYPVAERLARPLDIAADGLIVVDPAAPAGRVEDLDRSWVTVTLDGTRSTATARPTGTTPRYSAFVAGLDLRPLDEDGAADVALGLVLPCFTILGMLDRAIDLTRVHVREREQFGQPLSAFQSVQFQLTDAEVERSGLDMLAKYALWSIQRDRPDALADALALRMAAIEAAEIVMRVCHQLHGATGFCDETSLSWVSRHVQPLRRLPFGMSGTREQLTTRLGRHGLNGLFP